MALNDVVLINFPYRIEIQMRKKTENRLFFVFLDSDTLAKIQITTKTLKTDCAQSYGQELKNKL